MKQNNMPTSPSIISIYLFLLTKLYILYKSCIDMSTTSCSIPPNNNNNTKTNKHARTEH